MAERLRPGAIVVTFTKGLASQKFELLDKNRYRMSWGPATGTTTHHPPPLLSPSQGHVTVFIHRKLNEDGTPVLDGYKLNLLPSDEKVYYTNEDASSSSSSEEEEEEEDWENQDIYAYDASAPLSGTPSESEEEDKEQEDLEKEYEAMKAQYKTLIDEQQMRFHAYDSSSSDEEDSYEESHPTEDEEGERLRVTTAASPLRSTTADEEKDGDDDLPSSPVVDTHAQVLNSPQDAALLKRKQQRK